MIKKLLIIILIIAIVGLVVYFFANQDKPAAKSRTIETAKEKVIVKPTNQEKYEIVKHKYYTLAYSEKNEQPAWVCYSLTKKNVGGKEPRSNNFVPDPMVSTKTADDIDYVKSGYDKGHMVPAADMSWSPEAMKETFYYSNVSPQFPSFNRGEWKKLEEKVRGWAAEFDSVKVYTGPIFKDNIKKIGPDSVTVPGHYFKVIAIYHNATYSGIGFIFPNKKVVDPLYNYAVSIDSVENYSNLDFYNYLPESTQKKMESGFDLSIWGLRKTK
jgi:endonuclease G